MSPRRQSSDEEAIGEAEVPRDLEMAREMGEQSADISTLKSEVSLLRKDVSEIKEMLATNRGGIRMLLSVGGIAASLGAGIAEIIHWWHR
jgi:hypothetical protein